MTTSFKLTQTIDELTKDSSFVQELLRSGKAQKNVETSIIEYVLQEKDFGEGNEENLKYIKGKLGLNNNNWGYLKFNDAYERVTAYCVKVYNLDGALVLDVGSENEQNGDIRCIKHFQVNWATSELRKTKEANYTLNGYPVKLIPTVDEDRVTLKTTSIVISLPELDVEIPFYRNEDIKTEKQLWDMWEKGEAHLIAQLPYQATYYSNKIFDALIANLLKNKTEFPKEGVAFLIANPVEVEIQKLDGTGSFFSTHWDVYGCSHPQILGINSYFDKKKGEQVVKTYHFADIKKLSFNRSSNPDTPYSAWVHGGSNPMVGIVWFTGFNKNPNHIPKHKMYPMIGDDYDLPDRFIDLHEEFLGEIDGSCNYLIEKCEKAKAELAIKHLGASGAKFAGLIPASQEPPMDEMIEEEFDDQLTKFGN